tara:strand:- start:84322 stop:84945 length:624 start_codon:yes stop_codon:yes gene_type:complete
MRLFSDKKILIASHNEGKISEIKELLYKFDIQTTCSKDYNLPEPIEDGNTFEENAYIKARSASELTDMVALSDDSGLEVEALNNQPGIYSARWAGEDKDFDSAMLKINNMLEKNKAASRKARFVCALCLYWPDGIFEYFVGKVEGTIVWPPRGEYGFGYDSIFLPDGLDKTFGEISSSEKHSWSPDKPGLSHRARAFSKFVNIFNKI